MRCSKSCHLCDFELVDLFENKITEQVNYVLALKGNHSIMENEAKDFFEYTAQNSRRWKKRYFICVEGLIPAVSRLRSASGLLITNLKDVEQFAKNGMQSLGD